MRAVLACQNGGGVGAALLMAARIHDGDDITEPDFAVAVQRLAAAHDRIAAQGDIGALVIRRRKRETMRATMAAPNGCAPRRCRRRTERHYGRRAGDDAAQNRRRPERNEISGAPRKGGAPLIVAQSFLV